MLNVPTINVPIRRDMVQIISPMVGYYEVAVLKAVHGATVLEEQITPTGEFISLRADDEAGDGLSVADEYARMQLLYGKHAEQARFYVDIAYPNGYEQFAKAVEDSAAGEPSKAGRKPKA